MRIERALVDRDAKAGTARRRHMAVLHDEVGFRHQRIGTDDAEAEDEFAGRHDVLGRPAGIEMRAGRGFELREHGKPAAIDLEVGGFRDCRDLARRRDAAVLVELDAEHVGGFRGDDGVRVLDRQTGFVGHQRHAGRGAADRRHAGEVVPLHRLFEIIDAVLLQRAQAPASVSATVQPVFGSMPIATSAPTASRIARKCFASSLPAVGMAGLHAQHLDAELMQRALGVGDHLLRSRAPC